jgi:hypothetical protein
MQGLLSLGLNTLRQLVEYIGRLMNPAALMPGLGVDLAQSFPKTQSTITDSQLGAVLQTL